MRTVSQGKAAEHAEAYVVVDLGFGDAGKGVVVDALVRARGAHTVVRFNGGAQAAHNVVTPDGRHHTFSQFGAGTFVPGVRTLLSRHVVVHPTALLVEADHLARVGVPDALARWSASSSCRVITPFHQAANRIRELARGDGRHGSCGVGVGEVMRDALEAPEDVVTLAHLRDRPRLRLLLRRAQERLRTTLPDALPASASAELQLLEDGTTADAWIGALAIPDRAILDDDVLDARIAEPGAVVFEGAQGVLLDEWRGFHPYTTWGTCTFDNAMELVGRREVTRLGVLRTYTTRHGAGPFPTEAPELAPFVPEPHNDHGPWQGSFRVGHLDLVLLRYAIAACGGVDALAVTHLDAIARMPRWQVSNSYARGAPTLGPFRDLEHQAKLCEALFESAPELTTLTAKECITFLEYALGAPVRVASAGPTWRDVHLGLAQTTARTSVRAAGSSCSSSTRRA